MLGLGSGRRVPPGVGNLSHLTTSSASISHSGLAWWVAIAAALQGAFWAYDGWHKITYIGDELKSPQRDLPRSLILGILLVTGLYLLMSLVYSYVLPIDEMARSKLVAADVAERCFAGGGRWIALAVMLSTIGAANAIILTSARVYFSMARNGMFPPILGRAHPPSTLRRRRWLFRRFGAYCFLFSGTFDTLTDTLIFVSWFFYAANACAVIVLRRREPGAHRPFRVPLYPVDSLGLRRVRNGLSGVDALERPDGLSRCRCRRTAGVDELCFGSRLGAERHASLFLLPAKRSNRPLSSHSEAREGLNNLSSPRLVTHGHDGDCSNAVVELTLPWFMKRVSPFDGILLTITVWSHFHDGSARTVCGGLAEFLGPHADNASSETGLLDKWPAESPSRGVGKKIGTGYTAPSVRSNRLVLFHRVGNEEVVESFEAATGKAAWRYAYPSSFIGRTVITTARGARLFSPKTVATLLERRGSCFAWTCRLANWSGSKTPPRISTCRRPFSVWEARRFRRRIIAGHGRWPAQLRHGRLQRADRKDGLGKRRRKESGRRSNDRLARREADSSAKLGEAGQLFQPGFGHDRWPTYGVLSDATGIGHARSRQRSSEFQLLVSLATQ